MDKVKEQAVLTIVELLKKEQAAERAKEYENQLLEMLEEQDRKEIAEVQGGSKLPPCCQIPSQNGFSALTHTGSVLRIC